MLEFDCEVFIKHEVRSLVHPRDKPDDFFYQLSALINRPLLQAVDTHHTTATTAAISVRYEAVV